jgi:hypothetical protein
VVLVLLDLLLELVQGDLLVLDDQVDLELLDTETDGNQLGGTPDETVLLDGENVGLELVHVCLVIPWLNVKGDNGLGSRLDLASLLLVVLSQALLLDPGGLGILLLVVTAEQVDVVVVLSLLLGGLGGVQGELGGVRAVGSELLGWVARKGVELALEGEDVVVPAPCVWVLLRSGDLLDLLEDLDIGLRWGVAIAC